MFKVNWLLTVNPRLIFCCLLKLSTTASSEFKLSTLIVALLSVTLLWSIVVTTASVIVLATVA